jgi:hypothetical protein
MALARDPGFGIRDSEFPPSPSPRKRHTIVVTSSAGLWRGKRASVRVPVSSQSYIIDGL